ncbi:AbrB/MazE/SpoVT family DNA-binding domain-containing protein [Dactylosporangium sp. AC04546]|uniref:AbrB/MazE/SpoVT family DNA-binding domain-containing protein n=1 Tax=Dactylosporangium sp. AC04546 TaxID=2862460 RepID=UPI001EDF0E0C|nr:AbrB/MazE/SpoVT family DNA-binding domain-containing protein [Dactylosporangium sp. AC04546]WVK80456.1 AbrB/MazE/SpoVT family DNA-binding domain-containing protein [Dactylosporangium sp. AC04546]
MTSVDAGGRLADRSPLQLLGWKPRLPIRTTVTNDVVVIVPCPGQTEHVSSQGRIRLSSSTRRILGVAEGDRLFVVAAVDDDTLTIYPMWLLDSIVMEFDRHASGRGQS